MLVEILPPPERRLEEWEFEANEFPLLFEPVIAGAPRRDTGWVPSRQLLYLARYLGSLNCARVVFESHYIDRDFMEDFGAYYSRSFVSYPNHCKRLHFFRHSDSAGAQLPGSLLDEFDWLRGSFAGVGKEDLPPEVLERWGVVTEAYLGFVVVRPLPNSPIAKTVLKSLGRVAGDGASRFFEASREYPIHLAGLDLVSKGVPFQQQDKGTSACATTAVWSAMHKLPDAPLYPATPAEITRLATQYSLASGRALPSEGLTIGQMCEAVRGAGLAPYLYKHFNRNVTIDLLHLSVSSGLPAVIIVRLAYAEKGTYQHAVTIVGGKFCSIEALDGELVEAQAARLTQLYVHDDTVGPYVSLDIVEPGDFADARQAVRDRFREELNERLENKPEEREEVERELENLENDILFDDDACVLRLEDRGDGKVEHLVLKQLLFPLHDKIRMSFHNLQHIAAKEVMPALGGQLLRQYNAWYQIRIMLGTHYVSELMESGVLSRLQLRQIAEELTLSRYVGIIRIGIYGPDQTTLIDFPMVDLVLDTTGTELHAPVLAAIELSPDGLSHQVMERLSALYPEVMRQVHNVGTA